MGVAQHGGNKKSGARSTKEQKNLGGVGSHTLSPLTCYAMRCMDEFAIVWL